MKHGALFNGIGGFQLAADWVGWENVMSCEIDEWCNERTKKHYPNCIQHKDVRTTDFTIYRGAIDILTGGEPCQPHSVAGKRMGGADERFLWPELLKAYVDCGAKYLVNENVVGSISNGVFDRKVGDLENNGYAWEAFNLPARAFGADHLRYRIFIVAYPKCEGLQRHFTIGQNICQQQGATLAVNSNANVPKRSNVIGGYSQYIRSGDGLSRKLDKHRVKALGNAIVPQVAFEIFKAIEQFENHQQCKQPTTKDY